MKRSSTRDRVFLSIAPSRFALSRLARGGSLLLGLLVSACSVDEVLNLHSSRSTPDGMAAPRPAKIQRTPPTIAESLDQSSPNPTLLIEENAADSQTYREPNSLFEVSFPTGYTYQASDNGVTFLSADGQFGGSIKFISASEQPFTAELLEAGLKQEYEAQLVTVEWQQTIAQPDGSIRIDWIGEDQDGNILDSVSFAEQRRSRVFVLNLHGINDAYVNHEQDAIAIVNSYRLLR